MQATSQQNEQVRKLQGLYGAIADAIRSYEQVLKSIDEPVDIHERLAEFHADHEQQLHNLDAAFRMLSIPVPDYPSHPENFVTAGFQEVPTGSETSLALHNLQHNETIVDKIFAEATLMELPADLREVLRHIDELERRHLRYIDELLKERVWETETA